MDNTDGVLQTPKRNLWSKTKSESLEKENKQETKKIDGDP
jgi:hypothetical protein